VQAYREKIKPNKTPLWYGKLVNYEYWPTWFFYIPIGVYVLYLMTKSRSVVYFTNVNPSIKDSGIANYSKFGVLKHIPEAHKPKGILVRNNERFDLTIENLIFPVIAKPDMGERGKGVALIKNMESLNQYACSIQQDFIIQEYCNYPEEAAIFYIRKPSESKGRITSFTTKEFLSVKGDGLKNIGQLMGQTFRARLQIAKQKPEFLSFVPLKDKIIKIEAIGNHNRGTRFINSNHLISEKLIHVFDRISLQIDGFYYGRYDLKFNSIDELEDGINFKIVELNGINSEPVHIYDQSTGLWNAYRDCFQHYNFMYQIGLENHKLGNKRSDAWAFWKSIFGV